MTARASDITDWAIDMGVQRPRIHVFETWGGGRMYTFRYGPLDKRQSINLDPTWPEERIKAEIAMTLAEEPSKPARKPKRSK